MEKYFEFITNNQVVFQMLKVTGVLLLAGFSYVVSKKYLTKYIKVISRKTKTSWDDIFVEEKVFRRLANIVPAMIILIFKNTFPLMQETISRLALAYIVFMLLLFLDAVINSAVKIYNTYEFSKNKPIKGYVQTFKIIMFGLGIISAISILIGKSPTILLSGIGAMTAILMLIFKDSILSLIAGIQLSYEDMIRPGDWISMPKYNADGDVVDIALHTIKIQNFDKTITTIPTYKFISESFKNWRGMADSGGRRIKRSINIDLSSIKFMDTTLTEKLKKADLLKEYIESKDREITKYNAEKKLDKDDKISERRLTNIGTFRTYLYHYLKNHSKIRKDMTLLVRQLEPVSEGLPVQIYAFTNDNRWKFYEDIQADIFDHIFAVISEFELKVFQKPTGNDFQNMIRS